MIIPIQLPVIIPCFDVVDQIMISIRITKWLGSAGINHFGRDYLISSTHSWTRSCCDRARYLGNDSSITISR
jgi:hypothetical protein